MWAGQYRKYPRQYGAQAWKYPWICRRNDTFSGLGPTVAGEDVELPIISGPLSTTNLRPNVDIVCGNSPRAGAAPGLQYWLRSGPKMTCLGYYHVLHLLPALPFCRPCANIFMFTTTMRSRCTDADFLKYTHCFWISDFGKIVFFPYYMWHIFSKAFNTLQTAVNFYERMTKRLNITCHQLNGQFIKTTTLNYCLTSFYC